METRGAVDLSEQASNEIVALREQVTTLMAESATLEEGLDKVMAMLRAEDRDWLDLYGSNQDEGFDLDDLREWSEKIRPSVVAAPWIGRGYRARTNFIWKDGIKYGNIEGKRQGKGINVQELIDKPVNQRHFFGSQARRRREGCLYHDGLAVWFGDDNDKTLEAIPLSKITADFRDPDNNSIIWAYRHSWSYRNPTTGKSKDMHEWVFVDAYVDKRSKTIRHNSKSEPVSQNKTAFDMHANSMEGFAYGSPDAVAAYIWNAIARDATMDGVTMQRALAAFAFKATSKTKAGSDNVAMKVAGANGAGNVANVGGVNDLVPMSSAGKGYDFSTLTALTAIVATSLDISNMSLTNDVATAGAAYGSAQTLDLPTRLAMEARRTEHVELDLRVLKWMGSKKPEVYFDSLDDAVSIFREVQALLLLWSSGMYKPEPLERRLSDLMRIAGNAVPQNILLPNNSDSWERSDIDPKDGPAGSKSQTSSVGKPNATPAGQGQNSAAGRGANANDVRTDSEALNAMIARFGEMIDQWERAQRGDAA